MTLEYSVNYANRRHGNQYNEISVQSVGHFDEWYTSIRKRDPRAAAKIDSAITQMRHGNLSSNVKSVGGGVFQWSINYGPGYRIYFGRAGQQLIVLLGGATKTGQQAEITDSRKLWQDYQKAIEGEVN